MDVSRVHLLLPIICVLAFIEDVSNLAIHLKLNLYFLKLL